MADAVLIVTTKGFGKVVDETEFPTKGRGGRGVAGFKVTEDSGAVAAIEHVKTGAGQRVLLVTAAGMALMTSVDDISVRSRSAGGVKVMNVADDDEIAGVLV
jgi:DNA gyrase subunit A